MKIKIRDIVLLISGVGLGAIVTALLTSTPPQTFPNSAARVVATGPRLTPRATPKNFLIQLPPLQRPMPSDSIGVDEFHPLSSGTRLQRHIQHSLDVQNPLDVQPHLSMHLIDTRYQPDVKVEDLK